MDSPCHNSIYFSSYQKEAHLISRLCKVNLLTQCNTVNIITSFCPPFFLLSLMCALIPSAWFIFFALSLVFLPLSTSFYPCTTDTSVCISFLCIQNQLSMAQNTKVEEQRNTIMVGQYPALERPQNKLICNESIYSYHGNLQGSHLTLLPWNSSFKKQANKSVCCMNPHSPDQIWTPSSEQQHLRCH